MSIPPKIVKELLDALSQERVANIIAQADARRILQEVEESTEHYPSFDPQLTEKATHVAYALISCGCSLIENKDSYPKEGLATLERAGKILSDIFRFNRNDVENRDNNLLIAGMALYAAKQYSRAFIVLKDVSSTFKVGQMVIAFVKKDFEQLNNIANSVIFSPAPESKGFRGFDEWVISHEIARCFLILMDFIDSGNKENFEDLSGVLKNLLLISSEDSLTLYWLIIRLLNIILSTFRDSSLWYVLPPLLPEGSSADKYIRVLGNYIPPVIEMWPSQTDSLPLVLGERSGAVINLRTSAGKTRVAEVAILEALSGDSGNKILYLAPFRSLALEIEQSLNRTFAPLGIAVSQLYGGATVNVSDVELVSESQIIIATPEKAKALIRSGNRFELDVELIVIDEGHLLGADKRCIRNEMFLTHMIEFASRNKTKVLLLSAVLPNANELAQWIAGDSELVAKSAWKPSSERYGFLIWDGVYVRLEWKSEGKPYNPKFIQKGPLGFGKRRTLFPKNKNEAIAATAVKLARSGTVMIYCARANSIFGIAKSVLMAMGEEQGDYPWNSSLWSMFHSVCREELDESDKVVLSAARKGIICHSNRLPTLVRMAIEKLMRSKPPLVIIASSTLGQGVNVGVSTVIVASPYYSDKPISNRDFWNICGRAGRAFSDTEGKILYSLDAHVTKQREQWQVRKDASLAQHYLDSLQLEKVESGLHVVLNHILKVAEQTNTDLSILVEAIANDFQETGDADSFLVGFGGLREFDKWFDFLDDELLAMHEDFAIEDRNLDWVDDVFRKSLAVIQADAQDKGKYLQLLRARTSSLLNRSKSQTQRKKLVASGIPLSVSQFILDDLELFRNLATSFMQELKEERNRIDLLDKTVHELEIWSNQYAAVLFDRVPLQPSLDNIRYDWLSGRSLASIRSKDKNADTISKDYYGFTLPWIIHAVSQMFDPVSEEEIVHLFSNIAMCVELGLPDETTVKIFLAGIRSRSTALELSELDALQNKSVNEVKKTLLDLSAETDRLSHDSRDWINSLAELHKAYRPVKARVPKFTLERKDLPSRLYLREYKGKYYLTSLDCTQIVKVESSDKFSFGKIANTRGLYFEFNQGIWELQSYNPLVVLE